MTHTHTHTHTHIYIYINKFITVKDKIFVRIVLLK